MSARRDGSWSSGSGTRFLSGISVYTVRLANALADAGERASMMTMRQLLPTFLYPGQGSAWARDLTDLGRKADRAHLRRHRLVVAAQSLAQAAWFIAPPAPRDDRARVVDAAPCSIRYLALSVLARLSGRTDGDRVPRGPRHRRGAHPARAALRGHRGRRGHPARVRLHGPLGVRRGAAAVALAAGRQAGRGAAPRPARPLPGGARRASRCRRRARRPRTRSTCCSSASSGPTRASRTSWTRSTRSSRRGGRRLLADRGRRDLGRLDPAGGEDRREPPPRPHHVRQPLRPRRGARRVAARGGRGRAARTSAPR